MILKTLSSLSNYIKDKPKELIQTMDAQSEKNPWFINRFLEQALKGIEVLLEAEKLGLAQEQYFSQTPKKEKVVGTILAGNIPMVGFHDILCVLLSKHKLKIKYSSKDNILLSHLMDVMIGFDPKLKERIAVVDRLKNFDAVIATGSNNTNQYFKYYFSDYPHIIRKSRTSVGLIDNQTSKEDLIRLSNDIFLYFGLGCRNVNFLLIPENFDISRLIDSCNNYMFLKDHSKYFHNYEYRKAVLLIHQTQHYDNGFALFEENDRLYSPISSIHFKRYSSENELKTYIETHTDDIQCVVGNANKKYCHVQYGQSQYPTLFDFADGVNTFEFLKTL